MASVRFMLDMNFGEPQKPITSASFTMVTSSTSIITLLHTYQEVKAKERMTTVRSHQYIENLQIYSVDDTKRTVCERKDAGPDRRRVATQNISDGSIEMSLGSYDSFGQPMFSKFPTRFCLLSMTIVICFDTLSLTCFWAYD